MIKIPPLLQKGDKVAVVAPAGKADINNLKRGIEILEQWGFKVQIGNHVFDQYPYFSSSDENRLKDIQQALDDNDIKAIFCARGGYGTVRIINNIDFSHFVRYPKWVIGFSDITYLLCKIQSLGIACIHGPMPASFYRYRNASVRYLHTLLTTGKISYKISAKYIETFTKNNHFSHPITGGNLTILSHTIGTPYSLDTTGKILLIEDLNEEPYKIERYLFHLKDAGLLDKVKGIIVGHFQLKRQDEFPFSFKELLYSIRTSSQQFFIYKFPVGHGSASYPLMFNVPLNIDVKANFVKITQQIF